MGEHKARNRLKEAIAEKKNAKDLKEELYQYYDEHYDDADGLIGIKRSATFYDLTEHLINGEDVYILFDDSIVRERFFDRLSAILDVDYGVIYDAWLDC